MINEPSHRSTASKRGKLQKAKAGCLMVSLMKRAISLIDSANQWQPIDLTLIDNSDGQRMRGVSTCSPPDSNKFIYRLLR